MSDRLPPWHLELVDSERLEDYQNRRWLAQRLSNPSREIRLHIAQGGLAITDSVINDVLLVGAGTAIDEVPCIAEIVRARISHVHLLKAPRGYDISHSEPCWADRIFVSVPERTDCIGVLRLAESVIHEAMHLHLSCFEQSITLVNDEQGTVFSPWRQTFRSYSGVLHGLFVFCCLSNFFKRLPPDREHLSMGHIRQRLQEIEAEMAQVDLEALKVGLSNSGKALVVRLLDGLATP